MSAATPEDAAFLAAFEAGTLAPSAFRHADHVRAAFLLLKRHGFAGALARMTKTLRVFAARHGVPERYHETVTVAFLVLVNERLHEIPEASWPAFARAHADLLDKNALAAHYTPEILSSSRARAVFVLPVRHA